jgi:hypothetical protein
MRRASDIPSGSWYFRDAFATGAGMSNPAWVDRAFVDQLTHFSGSVTEQIANYNQPHSYNFVCGGFRKTYGTGIEADWFLGLRSYEGFLKCTYALGQLGGVASYFGADAADDLIFGVNYYPAYDPLHPPHWVSQMLALGRVHALFSWVDDFILDGDLLPGDGQHRIKGGLPSMECFAKVSRGGFIVRDESIRCFARKLRNANRWLIVCSVAERLDGTDGVNTEIRVDTIPGLPAMSLLARPQGSVYVAELQPSGAVKLTQLDKAAPHPLNKPVFVRYAPAGAGKLRLYFHAPRFLETGTTIPPTDFSVQGITVTAASVAPETVEYGVVELSYTGTLAPQAILSYSGASLLDTDGNSVEPFSTGVSA